MALAILPLLLVVTVTLIAQRHANRSSVSGFSHLAVQDLNHTVQGIFGASTTYNDDIGRTLKGAKVLIDKMGRIRFSSRHRIDWKAKNQLSSAAQDVRLPMMVVGKTRLKPVADFSHEAPIVDQVQQMFATTATVFQRMNAGGDMLRVSDTAKNAAGERAIGTFIPAMTADGKPDPILAGVLQGNAYRLRELVGDAWFMAEYQPIKDRNGKIVGMVRTGVAETRLRDKLVRFNEQVSSAGKTDLFVIHAAGDSRGQFVLSSDKALEGQPSWDILDARGNRYVQELCQKALQARPGEISEDSYWLQPGDSSGLQKPGPQKMIARFTYLPDWDWVIGVQQPEAALLPAPDRVDRILRWNYWLLPLFCVAAAVVAFFVWRAFAGNLSDRIGFVVAKLILSSRQLAATSQSIGDRSSSVAMSARELMRATRLQGTSSGETAAATEAVLRNAEQSTKTADRMRSLSKLADGILQQANLSLGSVESAMQSISKTNGEILEVVASINEINFTTNIVSVNAAIEAARAGEAGRSFGFIAGEVRSLSGKCAEAANQTKAIVDETRSEMKRGMQLISRLVSDLRPMGENSDNIRKLAIEVTTVSQQQSESLGKALESVEHRIQQTSARSAQAAQKGAKDATALQSQVSFLAESLSEIDEAIDMLKEEFATTTR